MLDEDMPETDCMWTSYSVLLVIFIMELSGSFHSTIPVAASCWPAFKSWKLWDLSHTEPSILFCCYLALNLEFILFGFWR